MLRYVCKQVDSLSLLSFNLPSGKKLNDWGAQCSEVKQVEHGKSIKEHKVTTENVDEKDWNPNVTFFI